jgi:hypothetical protein
MIGIYLIGPFPQNQLYHNFADRRNFLGLPNFFDVMSNLPFLVIGGVGLIYALKNNLSLSWKTMFFGVLLVAPGSAYYHYFPTNDTLVWDRLPMTIGFMALTSELMSTFISRKLEKILLPLGLVLGVLSIVYWVKFDDLRPYIFVQLTPILLIPTSIFIFKEVEIKTRYLWASFAFYLLAKLTETFDRQIFYTLKFISGHSLKHILAAVAVTCFYLLCKNNQKEI